MTIRMQNTLKSQVDDVDCKALLCGLQVNFCVLTEFWCLMDLSIAHLELETLTARWQN